MRALIDDMKNEKSHPGHPKLVVSNNSAAEGLVFAKKKFNRNIRAQYRTKSR